jgi:hypothetical protein
MRWKTKALIQRTLSVAPLGRRIYPQLQTRFGRLKSFDIRSKVAQGRRLLDAASASGLDLAGHRTVEVGTGWVPIVPIFYWLHGQSQCDTYDISRLLDKSLLIETVRQFVCLYQEDPQALRVGGDAAELSGRMKILEQLLRGEADADQILKRCNISYHAPCDATETGLPEQSIDYVFSNTTLEHVPAETIARLFEHHQHILKPGGCVMHLIDLSDHFSHDDPSIASINFLQFSEREFSRYNTCFLYQNRLRPRWWYSTLREHGFRIIKWETHVNRRSLGLLPSLKLDGDFADISAEELCTSSIVVVARRL